jgi:hypothetical protein
MDLLSIPGYARAILQERTVRNAAFLGITESVGPFEVLPMTLRHWMLLQVIGSPLMRERTSDDPAVPRPDQLQEFLWVLSPHFRPGDVKAKAAHDRKCRKTFYPPRYLPLLNTAGAQRRHERKCQERLTIAAEIINAARAYVTETMQDRPPVAATLGFQADYFSDAAFFCARIGREYGWSQEETLEMPLKRLFQYLNEIKQWNGSKIPLCNPSDQVRSNWMREVNKQRKEQQ